MSVSLVRFSPGKIIPVENGYRIKVLREHHDHDGTLTFPGRVAGAALAQRNPAGRSCLKTPEKYPLFSTCIFLYKEKAIPLMAMSLSLLQSCISHLVKNSTILGHKLKKSERCSLKAGSQVLSTIKNWP
jgi:hypothetical protein